MSTSSAWLTAGLEHLIGIAASEAGRPAAGENRHHPRSTSAERTIRARAKSALQAPLSSPCGVIDSGLRGQYVDLGKFEMELPDLVLAPSRGVELVVRDRRQHEEPGRGRVVALI
jgi:hypothetical protein